MGVASNIVAGPFRAFYCGPGNTATGNGTLNGSNPTVDILGIINSRGIRQIRRFEGEDIAGDALGDSVLETVYLGGQMFLEFELEEANYTNVKALMNPFVAGNVGQPTAALDNEVGVPGSLMTARAGTLQLWPLYSSSGNLHTPAGAVTTPVRTYGIVTLAAGFDMESTLASRRRVIPIRLRCYPYSDLGSPAKYIWFSKGAVNANYYIL